MTPEQIITILLDQIAKENDLKTQEQLAAFLKTNRVALFRWKRGQFDTSTRILLPILWERYAAAAAAQCPASSS